MNKMTFRNPMMRVATLALCTALLGTVPMLAQDNTAPPPPTDQSAQPMGGHGNHMRDRRLKMLTRRLDLSPDQVSQIKAIDQDTTQQSSAVRNDSSLAPADRRSKMMDIRKASQDKIRAVLNDDQKTKYDAMQAQMREHRQQRQGGQDAPPPPPPQQ